MASESSNRPVRLQLAGGTGTFEQTEMPPVPPPAPPRSRFSVATFLAAVAISALWGGGAGGYMMGWFGTHGLANVSLQQWAIFSVVTFVPPLLFLALAWTIVRGQAIGEATRAFAKATDKIFAADDSAAQSAQKIGRAVRHELDALNSGLDTAFGRMKILEGQISEQISALDATGNQLKLRGDAITQQLTNGRGDIDKSAEALNAVASQVGSSVADQLKQAGDEIHTSALELRKLAQEAGADVAGQFQAAKGDINDSVHVLHATAAKAGKDVATRMKMAENSIVASAEALRKAADGAGADVAAHMKTAENSIAASADGLHKAADGASADIAAHMKVAEDNIRATAEALHATATTAGDELKDKMAEARAGFSDLASEMSESATRAGETVAGRVAQLRLSITSAGKMLNDAAAEMDRETGTFREAVDRAADVPSQTAAALGDQIERMEGISEAAMTRAEDVLARQEAQRQAMADMLSKLKNDGLAIESRIAGERVAMEKILATLDTESKRFSALAGESERRIDAIMGAAAARTQEMARTFAREARGLRDCGADAGETLSTMITELREAAETAKSLIGDAAGWAHGQTGELVDNASRECNRLLKTAEELTDKTKAMQAALANSVEDVEKHLVLLPDVAKEEAEKIRETVRQETEQMLDQSARTMATLHARAGRISAGAQRTLPPEEQLGLDQLKRQLGLPKTAPDAPAAPVAARQTAPVRQTSPVRQVAARQAASAPVRQAAATSQKPTGNLRDAVPRLSKTPVGARPAQVARPAAQPTGREFRPPISGAAPARTKTKDWEMHSLLSAADDHPTAPASGDGALETLQNVLSDMAVDLDAIAGDHGPQMREWRRYLDGDHGVFARKLAGAIDGETVHRIAMLYREDPHFRTSADAYMAEFESVLAEVRSGDKGSLLATTLLSADTGKIYLAVAYALGRL